MPKIGPVPSSKLVKILEKAGFMLVRQKGSHIILMNERRVRIVIPMHTRKDVKAGLVRAIIAEVGLTREEFFDLLHKA